MEHRREMGLKDSTHPFAPNLKVFPLNDLRLTIYKSISRAYKRNTVIDNTLI